MNCTILQLSAVQLASAASERERKAAQRKAEQAEQRLQKYEQRLAEVAAQQVRDGSSVMQLKVDRISDRTASTVQAFSARAVSRQHPLAPQLQSCRGALALKHCLPASSSCRSCPAWMLAL